MTEGPEMSDDCVIAASIMAVTCQPLRSIHQWQVGNCLLIGFGWRDWPAGERKGRPKREGERERGGGGRDKERAGQRDGQTHTHRHTHTHTGRSMEWRNGYADRCERERAWGRGQWNGATVTLTVRY